MAGVSAGREIQWNESIEEIDEQGEKGLSVVAVGLVGFGCCCCCEEGARGHNKMGLYVVTMKLSNVACKMCHF